VRLVAVLVSFFAAGFLAVLDAAGALARVFVAVSSTDAVVLPAVVRAACARLEVLWACDDTEGLSEGDGGPGCWPVRCLQL
jgi:hypothetical protein